MHSETGTMMREGVPSIMNPDDKLGLELALQLKDAHGAEVTVITMGPLQAEAILREALAMGVDRAILLTDRKFAGADTLATSHALAGALRYLPHELILAGRQAIDGDTAQVGPQIAELLDLPQVSCVEEITYSGNSELIVKKQTEEGYQKLALDLPCLLTVVSAGLRPRYMSVRGIVAAYDREVETWDADRIAVDEEKLGLKGSPTKVAKTFHKGLKASGKSLELEPEAAVEAIMSALKENLLFSL